MVMRVPYEGSPTWQENSYTSNLVLVFGVSRRRVHYKYVHLYQICVQIIVASWVSEWYMAVVLNEVIVLSHCKERSLTGVFNSK